MLSLIACDSESSKKSVKILPNESVEAPSLGKINKPSIYTKEKWREALLKPFKIMNIENNDDGTMTYMACQKSTWTDKEKCKNGYSVFGKQDSFGKIDHLTPTWTYIEQISGQESYIGVYIAALECQPIKMLLSPVFYGKSGWLFMNRVSLLADGEIALERVLELHEVDRDNDERRIYEESHFPLTEKEIDQLRKYSAASNKLARITGSKGYVTISQESLQNFNKDIEVALIIYDEIRAAHGENGGPVCTPV